MSKGNPRITVRLPLALRELVQSEIDRLNKGEPVGGEVTMSDFVVDAVCQKVNHIRRGRKIKAQVKHEKNDDGFPRQFWDNIEAMESQERKLSEMADSLRKTLDG